MRGPSLPQEMNAEFNILLGKHKTALEIRDFLSGEFTPLPLADLMAVLRAREAAGTIRLVPERRQVRSDLKSEVKAVQLCLCLYH